MSLDPALLAGRGIVDSEVAKRIGKNGHILGIDRSAKAIAQAVAESSAEIASGQLSFRQVAIETFELEEDETPYDVAFAVRVGTLDGRHPETERAALRRIARALREGGRLYIDGGNPLREVPLDGE